MNPLGLFCEFNHYQDLFVAQLGSIKFTVVLCIWVTASLSSLLLKLAKNVSMEFWIGNRISFWLASVQEMDYKLLQYEIK